MWPGHLRLQAAYEAYVRNPNATGIAHLQPNPPDKAGQICSLAQEKASSSRSGETRSNEDPDEVKIARLSRWTAVNHRRM